MRVLNFFAAVILQVNLVFPQADTPSIHFFPATDTMLVIDGCTGPEILCSISLGLQFDSIIISPGFNTRLEYVDSSGLNRPIDKCYYLVEDSLHQFTYELWYFPQGVLPYFQQIPFDSAFISWDDYFEIKLIAIFQGIHMDSLIQFFKSIYGLGIAGSESEAISDDILLYPNYPNPFNATTAFHFFVRKKSNVEIKIYNAIGQTVATILEEEILPGDHLIRWNASGVSSGIYYIHLSSEGHDRVQKCLLIK